MRWPFSRMPQGATDAVDQAEVNALGERLRRDQQATRLQLVERQAVWSQRETYAAALNSTNNLPTDGSSQGVETNIGRVYAEARSVTCATAGALEVTLVSSQRGVRCSVRANGNITGGTVRYWLQDPRTLRWGLGAVDVSLPTGAQEVWTPDEFVTVGS